MLSTFLVIHAILISPPLIESKRNGNKILFSRKKKNPTHSILQKRVPPHRQRLGKTNRSDRKRQLCRSYPEGI